MKHDGETIAHRAMKSSLWIGVGFGASMVFKLISSVVLTRFIHPDTYGLMDLVITAQVLLHLLSDIGLAACLMQSPRGDDRRMVNTIWTLSLIRGVILTLLTAALAVPLARFYGRPILTWIVPVSGLFILLEALESPGKFKLMRHVQRGRLVAIEGINTVVTFLATLTAVYLWNSADFLAVLSGRIEHLPFNESLTWTVVIGGLTARLVNVILTYTLVPPVRPRFDMERETVREVFGFGRWILFSSAASFFAQQADRFITPKISSFEANGIYGRGLTLVGMATGLIDALASNVVFPTVSRVREQKGDIARALAKMTQMVDLAASTLLSGMFVAGSCFVHVIYPSTYSSVAWVVQALVLVGWFSFRAQYAANVLLGMGRPSGATFGSLAKLVILIALAAPAVYLVRRTHAHPLIAIIGCVGIGELVRYLMMLYLMKRQRLWQVSTELQSHFAMALITGLATLVGKHLTVQILGGAPTTKLDWFVATLVGGSVVVLLWGLVAAVLWRQGKLRLPRKRVPVEG